MSKTSGVYETFKKDGAPYYRASVTYHSKHISLGSYAALDEAGCAYRAADSILRSEEKYEIHDYEEFGHALPFAKWVMLLNLKNNGIYCKSPIYLRYRYFEYYLDEKTVLRFGADELFYYTNHSIQRRGGHLFVADYGSQINILSRYGIRSFAVQGRDYYFKNGDSFDFRSGNIVIINRYAGVRSDIFRGRKCFTARIHVGSDFVVGHYDTEIEAAIAYNKAAAFLLSKGCNIQFQENYIDGISAIEYKLRYEQVKLDKRFMGRFQYKMTPGDGGA